MATMRCRMKNKRTRTEAVFWKEEKDRRKTFSGLSFSNGGKAADTAA